METGKTIVMVNTARIHGALYDVFNQNFSVMATGDTRKIFSKVAIGPKTVDVAVHEDFQCIVHVKRSEFDKIPPPFRSRFQKYSFSINDFYQIEYGYLTKKEQEILKSVEEKARTFIEHFGKQYFYGLNEDTLCSYLLSLIEIIENQQRCLVNIQHRYSQLTIKSRSFIEEDPSNIQQSLLRSVLSKLIQLTPPEAIILKLPTLENKISRWLYRNYFQQQEHFSIENFIKQFIYNPLQNDKDDVMYDLTKLLSKESRNVSITTKVIIFTRTSALNISFNAITRDKTSIDNTNSGLDPYNKNADIIAEQVDILTMVSLY